MGVWTRDVYNQKWLLWFGIHAIALRRLVLYAYPEEKVHHRLRAHEEQHVKQYLRDGTIVFLVRYFWQYVRGRFRGKSHMEAYLAIDYEVEARLAEWGGV